MPDNNSSKIDMSLYNRLSRMLPLDYKGKFLAVAFVGTHIPLLGLLVLLLVFLQVSTATMLTVLGVALGATLVGTAATLWTLDGLLAPVENTGRALRGYIEDGQKPDLPTHYKDHAGELMADAQAAIRHLDGVIDELVHFDSVTRLPNRRVFLRQLKSLLDEDDVDTLFVFALRITNLSEIELSLGSDAAQHLLRVLANRLDVAPINADIAGRLGDADFVAAKVLQDPASAEATTRAWSEALDDALETEGSDRPVYPEFQVGFSVSPTDATEPDELVRTATARIRTDEAGDESHGASPLKTIEQNFEIAQALRNAASRNELSVVYQPIVDAQSGEMTSAETLMRWEHPDLGEVSPGLFIPVAERTGQIAELGLWVLRKACSQAVEWRAESDRDLQITVNLSPIQLLDPQLPDQIGSVLHETGLPPGALVLEITEIASLGDLRTTRRAIERLQGLGVSIALDDFGTGHASMQYLAEWEVDKIKIDRSFVDRIADTPIQQRICRGIIALGDSIGADIISEGVERREDLECLQDFGCRQFQGFLLQRPCPAHQLEPLIRRQKEIQLHG